MGRYLTLAREVAEKAPATRYDINDKNDQSPPRHQIPEPGADQIVQRSHQPAFEPIPEPGPGATAQLWLDWYEERAAIRGYDADYPRPMAEALAYGEAVNRWHRLHGKRPDPAHCAGCAKLLSGGETLKLPDSARVHVDSEWTCLRTYGRRWRNEAVKALAEMGIVPTEAEVG